MLELGDASQSVDWNSIVDVLNQNHIPEIFLGFVGILALVITYYYVSDKNKAVYDVLVLIGVIAGIIMAFLCASSSLKATLPTLIIVTIASFALIIRPFRDIKFMIVVALFIMVIVYILLGKVTGNLDFLASGWPRLIVAFVAGAIVYMLLVFVQDAVLFLGKVFNAWPVLAVLGILCIAEAICVGLGYGSIINIIMGHMMDKAELI